VVVRDRRRGVVKVAKDRVRGVAALASVIGLAPRPEPRPDGISAIVRVRGEAEWIEPSLRSVRDFADEILVFDNGAAPGVAATVGRLQAELTGRLTVERCPDLDFVALSNRALERARYRWVMRWDADMVAHTSGHHDIAHLRRYLLGLDPRRGCTVMVPAAEVAGDLAHQFADRRVRFDGQAHTASASARYVNREVERWLPAARRVHGILTTGPRVRHTMEVLATPLYYRALRWDRVAYVHVDVKPGRQLVLRHFWPRWRCELERARYPTLEAYALARVREDWGCADLDAAVPRYLARYCEELAPFDPAACGPLPDLLRPYVSERRYRVEYRDGRIVGRREPV